MITCSIWPRSKRDGQSSGASVTRSVIPSPRTRRSSFSLAWATSFRSSTSGWMNCRRANVSSCRVRSRARSAAPRISSTSSMQVGAPASASIRSDSTQLRTTVSRLLKSWATPPASWPMAAMRAEWSSPACSRFRSSSPRRHSPMSRVIERTRSSPSSRRRRADRSAGVTDPSLRRKRASRFSTTPWRRRSSTSRSRSAGSAQIPISAELRPRTSSARPAREAREALVHRDEGAVGEPVQVHRVGTGVERDAEPLLALPQLAARPAGGRSRPGRSCRHGVRGPAPGRSRR